MDPSTSENARLALAGELYHAFVPELVAARTRCQRACNRYNNAGEISRRRQIELWRDITQDTTPLPSQLQDPEQDTAQLQDEPWVEGPVRVDYGTNLRLGSNVYINFNCTILDTCLVTIGSRTLLASNVSLYSATHPLDPALRNGTKGPELGKEIHIGEDCFIGGNVTVCPGVKIGRGSTVGAGSVVTKDVPEMCVMAGNPARVITWLDGRAVDRKFKDGNGMPHARVTTPNEDQEADGKAETTAGGVEHSRQAERQNEVSREGEKKAIPGDEAMLSKQCRDSKDSTKAQDEDERLMMQAEWEEEIGRQIAEKALLYGASLK